MKRRYRRVIAKIGTNVLTSGGDTLDLNHIRTLVDQAAGLQAEGVEVIIVSSGAVAAGRAKLAITRTRRDIPFRQVLAAVGQSQLMQAYDQLFSAHGIAVAQTLLTRRDLSDRLSYLNARNTLLALLHYRVLPIVNENDAVAVEELAESRIGENDTLAALTANLVDADLLVLLTTREGLFTADPRYDPSATLVTRVERIDATVESYAGGSEGGGSGGMVTKLRAARLATAGGTDVVIASGLEKDVLPRLVAGEAIGTLFPASADRLESRKRWILSGLSIRGSIVVDEGAARALKERKTSLLPAGISDVCGAFERGETVEIANGASERIACGIANYSSEEMLSIRGAKSSQIADILGHDYGAEAVHRDNLVLV
ncbi:MAG TPA: glutamate 5-kinase [Dehalococcoidia bacterium]|nr:glutamate 5-kinase [Dehalococcoidia bacterium]